MEAEKVRVGMRALLRFRGETEEAVTSRKQYRRGRVIASHDDGMWGFVLESSTNPILVSSENLIEEKGE